jgi:hypothetical protein
MNDRIKFYLGDKQINDFETETQIRDHFSDFRRSGVYRTSECWDSIRTMRKVILLWERTWDMYR